MTNEKMITNKAFYEAVIEANLSDEITEKAKHLLEQTVNRAAKPSKETLEKRKANEEMINTIFDAMNIGDSYTAASVVTDFGVESSQKASYLLREMVKQGKLVESEARVNGKKVKTYKVKKRETIILD